MNKNFNSFDNNNIEDGKTTAIIAYILIIGTIVAMFMNLDKKNTFASFHIRQALGLNISFYALAYIIGNIDSWMASAAFYVFFMVLWIFGFVGCLQNEKKEIPFLGAYFQKWFKNL